MYLYKLCTPLFCLVAQLPTVPDLEILFCLLFLFFLSFLIITIVVGVLSSAFDSSLPMVLDYGLGLLTSGLIVGAIII